MLRRANASMMLDVYADLFNNVELRGFEPLPRPAEIRADLYGRSVSVQFSPARYLRFRSRHLTASRAVITASCGAALRAGAVLQPEVGRNLFQQSVQFGALGGVECGDGALFQRFLGGFDFGTKGAAAFCCFDEHGASVGGVGGPGDFAGAL